MTKKKTVIKRKPKIKGTLSAEALEVLALPKNTFAAPSKASELEQHLWTGQDIREVLLESLVTETLGDMLQQARQTRKITGEKLGKRIGVSKARIAQLEALESGKVELQTLTQYARALGYQVNISFIPEESEGKVLSASL
jgi:DNA-binding XRE family transcriptional regulator